MAGKWYLQAETDDLYKKINEYEMAAKEANAVSDKYDADIRDMSKKVQKLEVILNGFYHEIDQTGWVMNGWIYVLNVLNAFLLIY